MRTASLAEAWGGNAPREARTENPQRPYGRVRSGRSDLGGEPIGGPAQACMTAASNKDAVWKSLYGYGGAPTRSARGAGRCRGGRTGSMHATSRRGRGPSPQRQRRSTTAGQVSSQPGRTATGTAPRSEGPTEAAGGVRTGAGVRTSADHGGRPTDLGRDPRTTEVTPGSCPGGLGPWPLPESPDLRGRGTMARPGKSTMAQRGGCGAALKLRARWAGDRWEAKVSTGRGKAHRPGSSGGLGTQGEGGQVTPPRHRTSGRGNPPPPVHAPEFYPDRMSRELVSLG
jgi:hypothetical protein